MPSVAEWFLKAAVSHGCEVIFLNPGTDTPPLQEAYARMSRAGEPVPRLVVCPHETVAATAAQGYYLASGKAQIAFVHVDVGTANAAGSLNDARASKIPMLLCAGVSPSSVDSRVPGARGKFINWQQDVPDQTSIVRNYVKSAQTVSHASTIGTAMDRAFQIACSAPAGPVYLAFPREVLMEDADDVVFRGPKRAQPTELPGIGIETAQELAQDIIDAEFPLLITGYAGRTTALRQALSSFAEELAVPVVEYRGRFNLPLEHPLHLGFNVERWIDDSDLVIVVDHDVPFVPADRPLRETMRVIHLGPDPINQAMVVWGFPADKAVVCDVEKSLLELRTAGMRIRDKADEIENGRRVSRRERVEAMHQAMLADVEPDATVSDSNVEPYEVGRVLSELCPDACVFEEAVTSGNPFAYGFRPSREGDYLRNGGTFLGWGLGAAIGAKMADPQRMVVSVVGDGSFLFGVPSVALWVSKSHKAPILIVILNNRGYNSVRLATREAFPAGTQMTYGHVGTELPELPDFPSLADACGAAGYRVGQTSNLQSTLRDALSTVRAGRTAVVEVMVEAATKPL